MKGSLGRIQVCNIALKRVGERPSDQELRWGLDQLFKHHRFPDVALRKPIPHEAYYRNAAYFYLFGHYYAAPRRPPLRLPLLPSVGKLSKPSTLTVLLAADVPAPRVDGTGREEDPRDERS